MSASCPRSVALAIGAVSLGVLATKLKRFVPAAKSLPHAQWLQFSLELLAVAKIVQRLKGLITRITLPLAAIKRFF